MSFVRRLYRRLPDRRLAQKAAIQLLDVGDDPVGRTTVETVVDASANLTTRWIRRVLPGFQGRLTPEVVEKKYDAIAGRYIDINVEDDQRRGVYWIDGRLRETRRVEFESNMLDEHAQALARHRFDSLLEVGAGELTTLVGVAERIGPGRTYHGIDLSFPRVVRGHQYFARKGHDVVAARANALALPYADDSFDVVFSSHCLEHIPLDFREAIDEMRRVARRAVLLFEPSFELGDPIQKLRMLANGYVRGIGDYLASLDDVVTSEPELLANASPYNRTARYEIRLRAPQAKPRRSTPSAHFACPLCHHVLQPRDTTLCCPDCQTAHPVIESIPDLGDDAAYSIDSAEFSQSSSDENSSTMASGTTQGLGY